MVWRSMLLCLGVFIAGCQRPPMVLPAMFEAGRIQPLADVPEAERVHVQNLFYATDRRYDADAPRWRQYGRQRGTALAFGQLSVQTAPEGGWPGLEAALRADGRAKRFRPEITFLHRFGGQPHRLEAGHAHPKAPTQTQPNAEDQFLDRLEQALQRSPGKAITVYIHGFNNSFEEAALTAAEYDLFTGGLGPFIAYSWPSYDSVWEYSHDRDSVRYTTAHARAFVAMLSDQINAGRLSATRIHFIAHSTGAEVVGTVLRELALMSHGQTPAQRRARWRIGSVLLVAPDISLDVARERVLKEDVQGMFEELVVYGSQRDRALAWASCVLYRTPRLGAAGEADFTDEDRRGLLQGDRLTLVDIDGQRHEDVVRHSHHRFCPAVVSDIILCLRSGLAPDERGLVRREGEVLWRFAGDYTERATQAAASAYGEASWDD